MNMRVIFKLTEFPGSIGAQLESLSGLESYCSSAGATVNLALVTQRGKIATLASLLPI